MDKNIPRRQLDELLTRWTLAKLPLLVVEGPSDQRFLMLIQKENYCQKELKNLDIWPVEYIDVPSALVEKHGFKGTGVKQRAISFGREIEANGCVKGFRTIVDKDLDPFLPVDYQSQGVIYTDSCCMDVYSWTPESLDRMIVLYKCEKLISNAEEINELYSTIGQACADLAAVRLAAMRDPDFGATMHQSEKSLDLKNKKLLLNLPMYIEQCSPKKGSLAEFRAKVAETKEELANAKSSDLINGHDLNWILTFAFKELTQLPKRTIDPDLVSASLTSYGVMAPHLSVQPMFQSMAGWAQAL